jgi:hypothetical protein
MMAGEQSEIRAGEREGMAGASVAGPGPRLFIADVTSAFQGKDLSAQLPSSPPARASLTAMLMMLLPAAYFLLVFLIATGVILQLFANRPDLAEDVRGVGRIIGWFVPIFVGSALVLFLLKPVLIRPPAGAETIELTREPLLFCLVEQICTALNARVPARVFLDCEPRVTIKGGSVPTLVIGLPLVAGSTARQLAAALAHELSHLRKNQSGAAQTVRSIDAWCERIVYHRSSIDASIDKLCDSETRILASLGRSTRFAMEAAREVLRGLMMIGKRISHRCVRQLEFDADVCAAHVAGSQLSTDMLTQSHLLYFSRFIANRELEQSMKHTSCPRDYPGYIAARRDALQEPLRKRFVETAFFHGNASFATHPTLSQRSRRLATMDVPGVFAIEAPASALFADFTRLCEDASLLYYFSVWGEKFQEWARTPNQEYLANYFSLPKELLLLI